MTEFKVWRTIVDWVEDNAGCVIAACPPGSSVYDYKKFCLIDPVTGKRDEPDILFIFHDTVFFMECKPTLAGLKAKGLKASSDESDIEKLLRIRAIYDAGLYNQQLLDNYGVDTSRYPMCVAIGYAETKDGNYLAASDISQFIVSTNNEIKIVG